MLACAHREAIQHTVKPGENLYRIASYYGVPISEILDANGLTDPRQLEPGQALAIPDARRAVAQDPLLPPPGVQPSEDSPLEWPRSRFRGLGELRPNVLSRFRARREATRVGLHFAWPLHSTQLSSGFGRRNGRAHEGIDLLGAPGTPILAAEAGRVSFSGWLGDYGNSIVIAHGGGFATVYAHALELGLRKQERVARGQIVALIGATGNATGPHLHFEIRHRNRPRNPLLYLPAEP